ncbi:MAG TPA: hypothetical protein VE826_05155 [Dongiaceae bacterium]|nr:hypothetical protein [Dongiaceae bacterium]
MPTMLLDRPVEEILASSMPPMRPGGDGDPPPGPESTEPEREEEDDEDEASPS